MIENRSAHLLRRWVEVYTRGLPIEVGGRRREEIEADLWGQFEEAQLIGRSPRSTAWEVLVRFLAGIPADISWRLAHQGGRPVGSELARHPTSESDAIGLLAIVGGLALGTEFTVAAVMTPILNPVNPWASPGWGLLLVLSGWIGNVALAIATVTLLFSFVDRIYRVVAIVGSIGAMAAGLGTFGPYQLTLLLPVATAAVVLNLGHAGVLGRRLAVAHAVSAIAFLALVPLVLFAGMPIDLLFLIAVAYPVTWVAVGVSVRHGLPLTEPTAAA